ncbi:AbrB/MazE/SpoVT family DNA-binding domain-containing protein [Anaerocolumna chitinilytica]|uniref:AbrB family transcriptional regulator n=1 Tax=Anaerocolumna chitinilytica TaxID=1727145 RepID=A0A7I8DHY3_9FIRM|nr:AbrB/MazE/SpoVT family DNA-binding domain-containing protein [Anaerocolumna chitinilytica]BCJ98083.1 AbrB family transcriptional regulator [Anaerocolumna chitinilytica]
MARGFVRKIDDLGRIVIPIELRRSAEIMNRDALDMYLVNGTMTLSKGKGRKLDKLGRYTIPMEVRRTQSWDIGQALDIYMEGKEVCIRRYGCEWCDETEDLIEVNGHKLCHACAEKVGAAIIEA